MPLVRQIRRSDVCKVVANLYFAELSALCDLWCLYILLCKDNA